MHVCCAPSRSGKQTRSMITSIVRLRTKVTKYRHRHVTHTAVLMKNGPVFTTVTTKVTTSWQLNICSHCRNGFSCSGHQMPRTCHVQPGQHILCAVNHLEIEFTGHEPGTKHYTDSSITPCVAIQGKCTLSAAACKCYWAGVTSRNME